MCKKTGLATLEERKPDWLVFDFIDERHDLLACDETIVCHTEEWDRSGLSNVDPFRRGRTVRRFSSEASNLWLEGLARLKQRLAKGPLSHTRLALHRCYLATSYVGGMPPAAAMQLPLFPATPLARLRIKRLNDLLALYHHAFQETFPDAALLDVAIKHRSADVDHMWGPAAFHFVADYYRELARAARAAGMPL
jgi:hypothetical protein